MLKSMTGFGRCEITTEEYKISVEMKAVNHRYLDLSIKMPKKFNFFEAGIRNLLKKYIQRGKVDLFISYEDYTEGRMSLKYNASLAAEYMEYFHRCRNSSRLRMTCVCRLWPDSRRFLRWNRSRRMKTRCGRFWRRL